MCRLAGYVGSEPRTLASLVFDPPHSLEHAAYAPREMLSGHVNVDGTGVVWWEKPSSEPLRYVTDRPPWSDPNLSHLAPRLRGSTILAAVRSATPGIGFGVSNVAPFVEAGLAGVHNGWIGGFKGEVGHDLVARLSGERFGRLGALNDSLVLFSLVAQTFEDHPGSTLVDAVAETIRVVSKQVVAAGERAALNLVVAADGQMVACRASVDYGLNSLYVREAGSGFIVASEPLDDEESWTSLDKHTLAVLDPMGVESHHLDHEGAGR
ncbi:MAG: hypothetical protein ACLFVZ_01975 [Actinomycetota bacterium]